MKINITFLYLFFLFIGQSLLSQQITGFVLDSNSGLPIEGASIYFNNTTIGTTTNNSGKFLLDFDIDIKTPLVISFIGYETVILHSFSTTTLIKIYLNESTSVLNEVILSGEDDWSRELKLREFRKNYLGESENGLNCKILNEEDISLRYNKKKKQLTAYASKPILIENKNLKYIITVELEDFKVNYTYVSKNKKN